MTNPTVFDMPNSVDEFSVVLESPALRNLDFSGLDYPTARRAIIEYIKTYFPDDFNDFVPGNGVMMLTEIISSVVAKLSLRGDLVATDSTLATAKTEEAVINHLALINQRIQRQTPATTDIQITVDNAAAADIVVPAGQLFSTSGPDGKPVYYEVYRAPGDWNSPIVIPAGKRGVIAYGLEGKFATPVNVVSAGGPNQTITFTDKNILENPIFVTATIGNTAQDWTVITEPIERFGPSDRVVEVEFVDDNAILRFGDNVTGQAPTSGSIISVRYRTGGGIRGRIGVSQISDSRQFTPQPPANAVVNVAFTNVTTSLGGTDKESIEAAKKRAPLDFAVHKSIVTAGDYVQVAKSFSHPVYGTVSKAAAAARSDKNANKVEVYVLAEGSDGLPSLANVGLKTALATSFANYNVLTDYVEVLDGTMKPVDINMTVVVSRNADASVVKLNVENAIESFFALDKWEMGMPLYVSNFIESIKSIDGVAYIDVFEPTNNILATGQLGTGVDTSIGFNELITLGSKSVNYYYAKN